MKKIVVLLSGEGSNLQAIINACDCRKISGQICAVFSNKKDAYGLIRAAAANIAAHAISPADFADREEYDHALMTEIDNYQPDLIVLAGYMRVLSTEFVRHFSGKMLNIHPSLLPKYPGLHTHRKAMENGDTEHGTSVHFVTEQLDGGPVILQARVPIFPDDHENDIISRVQTQEHSIYPLVIQWFLSGRLKMEDNQAVLDEKPLPSAGYAAQ